MDVELCAPGDLQHAMALARAYERRGQYADGRSPRSASRVPPAATPAASAAGAPPAASASATQRTPPATFRRLSATEMEERRRQGLCFNCDEPFVRGHRCQRLFYLEVVDEDVTTDDTAPATSDEEEAPVISLLAMTGLHKPGTMHIPVTIQGRRLIALLDTGSTHNFLNTAVLGDIDWPLAACRDLRVTVANGDKVACRGRAARVPMHIASEQFAADFYAIPLDGFDVVLGVAFLCTLGPVIWDFDQLHLTFRREGRRVQWRGVGPVARQPRLAALAVRDQPLLDDLLGSFADVFATPTGLPPARACDHRIHLRPGTPPVAVRPYRYAQLQKDELERQVAAMLAQGIIRTNTSAFSAPVLLIKKHDQSWRFCIDYRALNDATAKDKFLIPVVDELLDELHGAHFFTKLDLRSGYHQVRMHVSDIEKTAFRTYHGHFEFLVMPFGLTNVPATFQALMNDSWSAHLQHLNAVVDALRAHSLFIKRSKCSFGAESVAYLGHVVSADDVAMDMDKVEAVASWPRPRSTRGLRGFLGLAGYYRKFIRDFVLVAAPLNALLRKDAFLWSPEAKAAFEALKRALSMAPVLQLPDFTKPFIVECDASGMGFGAVLQGAGPLAYISRPFAPRHLKISAYERELIGLVQAVRHWRPYLWGRHFLIRTDHFSLKFLLDQRLSTVPQHQWMSKLFGYDFTVEYRPGRLNTVADALSRRDADVGEATSALAPAAEPLVASLTVSGSTLQLYADLAEESATNPACVQLRDQLARGDLGAPWREHSGLLLHGFRVFVPPSSAFLPHILQLAHAAHEGIQKTLHRLRASFYIERDRAALRAFVRACPTCQHYKTESLQPAGLLQPLEVPSQVWADISMDFIEGLPRVHGKSVILTVVDRFSKCAHFIALGHPYTATSVARAFFNEIVRLHGLPASIVSDRGLVFTSAVWRDLFKMSGVKLRMSTAFHPQTDGQSEVTNRTIAMYLRCITGDRPRAWVDWLPWAEYCYNTAYHTALRATPFQVVYGREPPALGTYRDGSARTQTVDDMLHDRDLFLSEVRDRLLQAQVYSKRQYDSSHRALEFQVDDWIWLRLLHRQAASLVPRSNAKLGPRYAGPFQVTERIGQVAYHLKLPEGARIHDVFHVGLLKPFHGAPPVETPPLPPMEHGRLLPVPSKVFRAQLRRGVWHVLVHWAGDDEANATWEPLEQFQSTYPTTQLADEPFLEARRDVMTGISYSRRHRNNQSG
ncbi:hypothetical protein U9M48_012838 [Paspalum notatum var. saurae]|uniref:Uncharacterized protein n=1 Tax=Paspalum notatum var. saurae TaxID=547442 RepID=A0AAQ3SZ73_PASNO